MLGVVAERFPKGGALTLNSISGVGMLCVGVIGAPFLGMIQDKKVDQLLMRENPAIYQKVVGGEKTSVFGKYRAVDQNKTSLLNSNEKNIITSITATAKKNALMTVAIFPAIMLLSYLILIFYFSRKGGYEAVELEVKRE